MTAASQLEQCLCFFPSAVLYHRWGKLELAKKHYELSLKLDPEAPGTRDNYNMLRRKLDQLKRHTPWGSLLGPLPAVKHIFPLFHFVLFYLTNSGFVPFGNKDHDLCVGLSFSSFGGKSQYVEQLSSCSFVDIFWGGKNLGLQLMVIFIVDSFVSNFFDQ